MFSGFFGEWDWQDENVGKIMYDEIFSLDLSKFLEKCILDNSQKVSKNSQKHKSLGEGDLPGKAGELPPLFQDKGNKKAKIGWIQKKIKKSKPKISSENS